MNKREKVFTIQYAAEKFAEEVNGVVKESYLPDYMRVEQIWIVEWYEKEE